VTRGGTQGLEAPDPILEERIKAGLGQVESALERAVRADYELLGEAASYILAAGGKRFRPMLVLLSGHFGDPTDPRLIQGAVAIELTHVATLYHDDVMDEAQFRHGVPSVNAKWDNSVAILSGDFLFAKASELSADLGAGVTRLLARTIATVCDGQIRDVALAGRLAQTEAGYMETIRRKTAALIATSCRLGGMLSEARSDHVDLLEQFGEVIGMGFQLSDDIMDVIATEDVLGKPPGQDLRQGVHTLPILYALQDRGRGDELAELLADGPPEGDRLRRALELVASDGSLSRAREAVTNEVRRARKLAEGLPSGSPKDALLHLAEYLASRCGAGF